MYSNFGGDISHFIGKNPSKRKGTVKKRLAIFPSPDGMSLTKLSLAGKN
jgi:hypothetical protein